MNLSSFFPKSVPYDGRLNRVSPSLLLVDEMGKPSASCPPFLFPESFSFHRAETGGHGLFLSLGEREPSLSPTPPPTIMRQAPAFPPETMGAALPPRPFSSHVTVLVLSSFFFPFPPRPIALFRKFSRSSVLCLFCPRTMLEVCLPSLAALERFLLFVLLRQRLILSPPDSPRPESRIVYSSLAID